MTDSKCALKMKALLSMGDKSIVQVNDCTATKTINSLWTNSLWTLQIDVKFLPELWEVVSKGKAHDWKKGIGVPPEVRKLCEMVEKKYLDACAGIAFEDEGDAPEVPAKESLMESPNEEESVKQNESSDTETTAQDDKEENLRKLAELERIEQQMNEAEERKILEMAKRESIKEASAPKQQIENKQAPASKTPLLDMIFDYVGNDVLEVFGDTGSGKTAFVKKVAYEASAAGKKVFYLDTERNLTKNDISLLKKCKYQYTPVIDEIDRVIQTLPSGDVVILDSVGFPVLTTFARMNMKQKGDALLKMIAIFGSLKEWAYKNNGIVLVTNQPESEFNKAPNHILRPFGDKSQFAAKEIWETIKDSSSPDLTKSTIKAFRSRSVGHGKRLATMNINAAGVEVVRA